MFAGMTPAVPLWRVTIVPETGSTNADLLAAARRGEPAGAVLVADHQTAGRGRMGRTWEAPPGASLLCSVLFRPGEGGAPAEPHRCTQAVGVAAVRTCEEELGFTADLKWPNDVFVGDRKLAGVLAEAVVEHGRITAVVVGLGMNLTWPDPMPGELAATAISANHLTGAPVDRDRVLAAVLERLAATDWDALPAEYRRRLGTLGQRVVAHLPAGEVDGTAVDVTADGALVLALDDGSRREIVAGDVERMRVTRAGGR